MLLSSQDGEAAAAAAVAEVRTVRSLMPNSGSSSPASGTLQLTLAVHAYHTTQEREAQRTWMRWPKGGPGPP
jgi:hypothetical protein